VYTSQHRTGEVPGCAAARQEILSGGEAASGLHAYGELHGTVISDCGVENLVIKYDGGIRVEKDPCTQLFDNVIAGLSCHSRRKGKRFVRALADADARLTFGLALVDDLLDYVCCVLGNREHVLLLSMDVLREPVHCCSRTSANQMSTAKLAAARMAVWDTLI
jgi:hypothetical protein